MSADTRQPGRIRGRRAAARGFRGDRRSPGDLRPLFSRVSIRARHHRARAHPARAVHGTGCAPRADSRHDRDNPRRARGRSSRRAAARRSGLVSLGAAGVRRCRLAHRRGVRQRHDSSRSPRGRSTVDRVAGAVEPSAVADAEPPHGRGIQRSAQREAVVQWTPRLFADGAAPRRSGLPAPRRTNRLRRRPAGCSGGLRPAAAPDETLTAAASNGYTMYHWRSGGIEHWVVSDVNAAELKTFATMIQRGSS